MSRLTVKAEGRECKLQLHPYCNGGGETTSPCHLASPDKGWGIKSPDWWLVWACNGCHDVIDGRIKHDLTELEVLQGIFNALYRTQKALIEERIPFFEREKKAK